jgi:hypothetical protein
MGSLASQPILASRGVARRRFSLSLSPLPLRCSSVPNPLARLPVVFAYPNILAVPGCPALRPAHLVRRVPPRRHSERRVFPPTRTPHLPPLFACIHPPHPQLACSVPPARQQHEPREVCVRAHLCGSPSAYAPAARPSTGTSLEPAPPSFPSAGFLPQQPEASCERNARECGHTAGSNRGVSQSQERKPHHPQGLSP